MSQYLGAREDPPPEPAGRSQAAVTITVLALVALVVCVLAAGVVQFGSEDPDPEVAGQPAVTGSLEVEVATRLAAEGEGTCHVICQLDYRRAGPADDARLERLRPKLQALTIEIIRRYPRSTLASGAGLAELERQLLIGSIELLKESGAEIVTLQVVGMRFSG